MNLKFNFLRKPGFLFIAFILSYFSLSFPNQILSPNTLWRSGSNPLTGLCPCQKGSRQSPINISQAVTKDLDPILFKYQDIPLTIKMNEYGGIQVDYPKGSSISIGNQQYSLLQFHFHHPSEHYVEGKRFAIEAHLIHKNENGTFVAVAVFITPGKPNETMDLLLQRLPEIDKPINDSDVIINASQLLPEGNDYFLYQGSFTSLPFKEKLNWYVLKNPIEMSEEQITLLTSHHDPNARPIQPTNDRVIWRSS